MSKGNPKGTVAFPNTRTNPPSPERARDEDNVPATEVNDFINTMTSQTLYDKYMKTHLVDFDTESGEPRLREMSPEAFGQHLDNLVKIATAHASMVSGTAQRRMSLQERPAPVFNVPK